MALIKRYSNRKLYHCEAGRYITLEEITALVRGGEDLRVVDHASGRDLTGVVLLQAVLEEEKRLGEMLPHVVLTRLLQNGEESFFSLRTRLLAAFDPERHFADELRVRMERLVRGGEIGAEEGSRLVESLLRAEPDTTLTEEDAPLGAEANPPAEPSLQDLERIVSDLESELARLRGG
jgi:polyhydroxyalkanoate synthesis repressor PhaR